MTLKTIGPAQLNNSFPKDILLKLFLTEWQFVLFCPHVVAHLLIVSKGTNLNEALVCIFFILIWTRVWAFLLSVFSFLFIKHTVYFSFFFLNYLISVSIWLFFPNVNINHWVKSKRTNKRGLASPKRIISSDHLNSNSPKKNLISEVKWNELKIYENVIQSLISYVAVVFKRGKDVNVYEVTYYNCSTTPTREISAFRSATSHKSFKAI